MAEVVQKLLDAGHPVNPHDFPRVVKSGDSGSLALLLHAAVPGRQRSLPRLPTLPWTPTRFFLKHQVPWI